MGKKYKIDHKQGSDVQDNVPKNNSSKSISKIEKGGIEMSSRQEREPTLPLKERKSKSEWLIISPDGSITKAEKFNWAGNDDLKVLYSYESSGSREVKEAPAHVKMMQQLELVDYEPAADAGNFRWLPKGHQIKRLMERHASEIVKDYGGMQVETPIMYDLNHPQLASYLKRFPARQYHLLSGNKKYFLRFAACFGQ